MAQDVHPDLEVRLGTLTGYASVLHVVTADPYAAAAALRLSLPDLTMVGDDDTLYEELEYEDLELELQLEAPLTPSYVSPPETSPLGHPYVVFDVKGIRHRPLGVADPGRRE